MAQSLFPALAVCRDCDISYRTLLRWADQRLFNPKYLVRKGSRHFITEEGHLEIRILSRLRKHLPLKHLRAFCDALRDQPGQLASNGDYAVIVDVQGEKRVLWDNATGELHDLSSPSYRQLSLFDWFTLEEIFCSSQNDMRIIPFALGRLPNPMCKSRS